MILGMEWKLNERVNGVKAALQLGKHRLASKKSFNLYLFIYLIQFYLQILKKIFTTLVYHLQITSE